MISARLLFGFLCALAAVTAPVSAQSIVPLTSFGGGDGWFAPGEGGYQFLTGPLTATTQTNTERGLAYSAATNHLYLVSRANVGGDAIHVRVLDAATGVDTGVELNDTGIAGGTFPINKVAVGTDGAIYGANLRTGVTATATYKIYKWDNETSTPAVVVDTLPLGNDTRIGDDFDAIGGGISAQLVAGHAQSGTNSGVAGLNGYAIINPNTASVTNVMFSGTPPNIGDFRLGITFSDSDTVLGTQGGTTGTPAVPNPVHVTDFVGGTGTLQMSFTLQTVNERPMDFAIVGGVPVLATMEVGGPAATPLATNGIVRIYDITNPAAPIPLLMGTTISGTPVSNGNFAGELKWGAITGNTATLYALNTNNGIQAFVVTIPEPSAAALLGFGLASFAIRRRRA